MIFFRILAEKECYYFYTGMTVFIYIPIGLTVVFLLYILYLGWIKKDLKARFKSVVLPGLLFVGVWALIYLWIFI